MQTIRRESFCWFLGALAAAQFATLDRAEAGSALFRAGPDPAIGIAQVGTTATAPRFTLPAGAIKYTYFQSCGFPPNYACRKHYPVSEIALSVSNPSAAQFRPQNPYAPKSTTTFVGPASTTLFSNNYGHSRAYGSIRVTPGSNRFGGTMRYFYGPNTHYYQLISPIWYSAAYNLTATADWNKTAPTAMVPQILGYNYLAWSGVRNFTTPPIYNPPVRDVKTFYTTGPWTTGMIEVYNQGYTWAAPTRFYSWTGYDNRTPNGLKGVISLIKPRLVNNYTRGVGEPTASSIRHDVGIIAVKIEFLPEPRMSFLLASGIALLAGLYRG